MKQKNLVGEDMICPITNQHCDDECCTVGSECNISGDGISEATSPITHKTYKTIEMINRLTNVILITLLIIIIPLICGGYILPATSQGVLCTYLMRYFLGAVLITIAGSILTLILYIIKEAYDYIKYG